jgi:hypothetical protein
MSTPLDEFEFDFERSRAAVAVACLQWLRRTGPAIEPVVAREIPTAVADLPPIASPTQANDPVGLPHPLWDRWLDG